MQHTNTFKRQKIVRTTNRLSEIPLTPALSRFWRVCQSGENSQQTISATHFMKRFKEPVDKAMMERSLQALAKRHELLSARIDESDGAPKYVLNGNFTPNIRFVDISARDASEHGDDKEKLLLSAVQQLVWEPFGFDLDNLISDQLTRSFLIKSSDEDYVFGLVMHHILADHMSVTNASRDFMTFYKQYMAGDFSDPPIPLVQYADYLQTMNHWLAASDQPIWDENATSQHRFVLPPDFPPDESRPRSESQVGFVLTDTLHEALKEFSVKNRISLCTAITSAHAAIVMHESSSPEALMRMLHFGRDQPILYGLIGPFAQIVPLKLALSADMPFMELISKADKAWSEIDTYLAVSAYELFDVEHIGLCPVFDFLDVSAIRHSDNSRVSPYHAGSPPPPDCDAPRVPRKLEPLSTVFVAFKQTNGIDGYIHYASEMYSRETIARFIGNIFAFLMAAIQNPNEKLSTLIKHTYSYTTQVESAVVIR